MKEQDLGGGVAVGSTMRSRAGFKEGRGGGGIKDVSLVVGDGIREKEGDK